MHLRRGCLFWDPYLLSGEALKFEGQEVLDMS
jgi:hypothetical protein